MMVKLDFDKMQIDEHFASLPVVLASMESHIDIAAEFEVDRIYERNFQDWDDEEVATSLTSDEVAHLKQSVFPRVLRGSLIITIFAAFEDSVRVLEKAARDKAAEAPAFKRTRDQSFIDACCWFFRESLGFPLWSEKTIESLALLLKVRNTFAHQAGRLDQNKREVFHPLMTGKAPSLKDWLGYLVPSKAYVSEALDLCSRSIDELANQVMPGAKAVEFIPAPDEE